MGGPLHGYALKAWLERYMGSLITVNFGAIYPLLRRLSEQGLIESRHEEHQQRKITTYSITRAGRKRFKAEMLSFANESRVNARSRFLTKAYFFAQVSPAERIAILEQRLVVLSQKPKLEETELPGDEYKRALYEFAGGLIETEAAWVQWMLTAERASI